MTTQSLLISLLIFAVLAACGSSQQSPIQTREHFVQLGGETKQTAFAFTLTWFVPPALLFNKRRDEILTSVRLGCGRAVHLSVDKKTWLQLEDLAVDKLQKQLDKRELCEQGHKISQTIWRDQSVLLEGHCL